MVIKLKATGSPAPAPDLTQIRRAIAVFFDPDHHVFLQSLPSATWTCMPGSEATRIEEWIAANATGKGLYFGINPVQEVSRPTRIADVVKRRWILIDVDRNKKVQPDDPATDNEHEDAKELAFEVMEYLTEIGFPAPIQVDSGNGFHLYYLVDLPNEEASRYLVHGFLKILDNTFSGDKGKIGHEVFDARRISRMPATWSRRGMVSKERPYRQCKFVYTPKDILAVPTELLQRVVSDHAEHEAKTQKAEEKADPNQNGKHAGPPAQPQPKPSGVNGSTFNMQAKSSPTDKERDRAYGREAADQEKSKLANAAVGDRHNQLVRSTYSLWEIHFGGCLEAHEVLDTLFIGACRCGLDKDKEHGLEAGILKVIKDPAIVEKARKNPRNASSQADEEQKETEAKSEATPADEAKESGKEGDNKPPVSTQIDDLIFVNFREEKRKGPKGKSVKVKVGLSQQSVMNQMAVAVGPWPKVANRLLFVQEEGFTPRFIENSTQLFAWIGSKIGHADKDNNIVWQKQGPSMVSQAQYYEACRTELEQYAAVEPFPHEPVMPNHYYMHPPLKTADTGAFSELLKKFSPATITDYNLIAAAWMTPFAGIESGQRPAFLIQSTDDDKHGGRGSGKTTLAELIGRLCGGHIEMRAQDEWDRLVTRLLSPAALTKRIAILDNVKTLKFSWADFEAGITTDVISGRQLYVGEGRRPNNITYFITLNGANMSKDMSQRCVPIMLRRPVYDASWEEGVIRLIETRRWEIISDIVAILKAPAIPLEKFSRWSAWEKAVLSRVGDPAECQRVIAERQEENDEDQTESEVVREGLIDELIRRGHDHEHDVIWIPSEEAAIIVNRLENEAHRAYNRAMAHLYTLNIPEIRRSPRGNANGTCQGRGCVWTGQKSTPNTQAVPIRRI